MNPTTLHIATEVGTDRRIVIDLPPDFPLGPVQLDIHSTESAPVTAATPDQPLTRGEAHRRLLAAGKLSAERYAPEGAVELSDEERQRIGRLLADEHQTTLDLINEDRTDRD